MAKLKYTFDDYINNPSGKGSAVHGFINKERNGCNGYTVL